MTDGSGRYRIMDPSSVCLRHDDIVKGLARSEANLENIKEQAKRIEDKLAEMDDRFSGQLQDTTGRITDAIETIKTSLSNQISDVNRKANGYYDDLEEVTGEIPKVVQEKIQEIKREYDDKLSRTLSVDTILRNWKFWVGITIVVVWSLLSGAEGAGEALKRLLGLILN